MMKTLLSMFSNRRMAAVLFFGFSSGLPISLIGSTLQAWLTDAKIDIRIVGLFSLIGLPYTLKFLWAPLMDRYWPPFLGRRRGWILITQLLLILSLIGMAFTEPSSTLHVLTAFTVLVAFFSASQDIVADAYKVEVVSLNEYGTAAAVANLGYRLAMLFSGAIALILADHVSWQTVYLIMAASLLLGVVTSFLAPEPLVTAKAPRTMHEAITQPLKDFFGRRGSLGILLFIIVYKLDVVATLAFMTRFLMELGFTKTDIGAVTKGFGLLATLSGTLLGGIWMTRLGIVRSLWVFGILQGISGFCFYLLAHLGYHYPMMVITIAAENFFSGMGNAAYAAFLMSLCNPRFTATQFALLSSLMALTQKVIPAPAGWLVQSVGWESYYLIAMALGIPGLLLLTQYKTWETPK